MTGRALAVGESYVSPMADRVARVLEMTDDFTREERQALIDKLTARVARERERAASDALDEELGREAVRRLRELERGEVKGIPAEEFFDRLEARARSRTA